MRNFHNIFTLNHWIIELFWIKVWAIKFYDFLRLKCTIKILYHQRIKRENWGEYVTMFILLEKQSVVQILIRICNVQFSIFCVVNLLQMKLTQALINLGLIYNWIDNDRPELLRIHHLFQRISLYLNSIYRSQIRLSHTMLLPLNPFHTIYLPISSIFGRNVSVYSIPLIAQWMTVKWMNCGTILESKWQQLST